MFIHPKPQCLHIVYAIITAIPNKQTNKQTNRSPTLSTDTPCPEAERLVTTANVTPKTTNSNYVLPNTASNDIQQHVNSANSGDVDIRNLTVTLIRPTVVLQRSWYQMPGCSVQCKMKKNTHGYMTVWYTKGIYVSFVNWFVVILPHHKNVLLLALTLVQYDCYSITGPPN